VPAPRRRCPAPGLGRAGVRRLARLTLSCDHRVIDGAVGAAFLRFLGDILQDPPRLLL
jgi:pyruvate dehydrogenase E2 component (dihydrolipoamide acetyltransferase)